MTESIVVRPRHQAVHACATTAPSSRSPSRRMRRQAISDSFNAVDDVSFTVEQGESVGLMGLNGSGKSTLLKLINGVMQPDRARCSPAAGSPA